MNVYETAQLYFDLSNKSDLEGIANLLTGNTIYISQNTGTYKGRDAILAMQKEFHGKFKDLHWKVNSTKETEPSTVIFDYNFTGTLRNKEIVTSSGIESVTVVEGKITRIEIRNK